MQLSRAEAFSDGNGVLAQMATRIRIENLGFKHLPDARRRKRAGYYSDLIRRVSADARASRFRREYSFFDRGGRL